MKTFKKLKNKGGVNISSKRSSKHSSKRNSSTRSIKQVDFINMDGDLNSLINGINRFYKNNRGLCNGVFKSNKVAQYKKVLSGEKHSGGTNGDHPIEPEPRHQRNGPNDESLVTIVALFIGLIIGCCLCCNYCIWEIRTYGRTQRPRYGIRETPFGSANIINLRDREIERERRERRENLNNQLATLFTFIIELITEI